MKTELFLSALTAFYGGGQRPPSNIGFLHALESLVILAELLEIGELEKAQPHIREIFANLEAAWVRLKGHDLTVELAGWYKDEFIPEFVSGSVNHASEVTWPIGTVWFGGEAFKRHKAGLLVEEPWFAETFSI
ncbi:MAG: hypothetical protein HRU33_10805 [Rhodobacteraceae bacterium]|nr:hypothetical protein [Paracoccaceae bacterium]